MKQKDGKSTTELVRESLKVMKGAVSVHRIQRDVKRQGYDRNTIAITGSLNYLKSIGEVAYNRGLWCKAPEKAIQGKVENFQILTDELAEGMKEAHRLRQEVRRLNSENKVLEELVDQYKAHVKHLRESLDAERAVVIRQEEQKRDLKVAVFDRLFS